MDLSQEIGHALRRARATRGLSLREAARASQDRFRPSSIAGYERGERAITVQRFCDLAEVYATDPARLLAGILLAAGGESTIEIDLSALDHIEAPEAAILREFADRVLALREDPEGSVISVRTADLEVIAKAFGHERQALIDLVSVPRRT